MKTEETMPTKRRRRSPAPPVERLEGDALEEPAEVVEVVHHYHDEEPPAAEPSDPVSDFLIGAAVGTLFFFGSYALGKVVEQRGKRLATTPPAPPPGPPRYAPPPRYATRRPQAAARRPPPPPTTQAPADVEEHTAAALLGVSVDASEEQIRAAFRAIVKTKLERGGFHEQGGDVAETQHYTAAKARLVERARRRRGVTP